MAKILKVPVLKVNGKEYDDGNIFMFNGYEDMLEYGNVQKFDMIVKVNKLSGSVKEVVTGTPITKLPNNPSIEYVYFFREVRDKGALFCISLDGLKNGEVPSKKYVDNYFETFENTELGKELINYNKNSSKKKMLKEKVKFLQRRD